MNKQLTTAIKIVNPFDITRILKAVIEETFDLENKDFVLRAVQNSLNIYTDKTVSFNMPTNAVMLSTIA
jgi:hypothetical protein